MLTAFFFFRIILFCSLSADPSRDTCCLLRSARLGKWVLEGEGGRFLARNWRVFMRLTHSCVKSTRQKYTFSPTRYYVWEHMISPRRQQLKASMADFSTVGSIQTKFHPGAVAGQDQESRLAHPERRGAQRLRSTLLARLLDIRRSRQKAEQLLGPKTTWTLHKHEQSGQSVVTIITILK